MASVRKKTAPGGGTVTYQAIWRNPPGPDGQRGQRTKNFDKRADARAFAARMEQEVERRQIGDPQKQSLGGYLQYWLNTLEDRGMVAPNTLLGYRRYVRMISKEIGTIPLEKVTAAQIDAAYGRLLKAGGTLRSGRNMQTRTPRPLSAQTVLHVHRCLSTALKQSKRWKLIAENPAADATAPSPQRSKVRAFTTEEVHRLVAAAEAIGPDIYTIVAVLLTCGLRRSELLGLAADDVDHDALTLTVRRIILALDYTPLVRQKMKTASSARTVSITPALAALLREQHAQVMRARLAWGAGWQTDGPDFLFPAPGGGPMNPHSLTGRLKTVMRRAKVTAASPTHAWRHTSATLLVDAGKPIKTVQARLGHSTPAITMALYVHPVAEADREAAAQFDTFLPRRDQTGNR
jgi:integrase